MRILFLDETNTELTKISNFFIYGGIFFPAEIAHNLHLKIVELRNKAGFKPRDQFKFDTHSRPSSIPIDAFNQAKDKLINLCIDSKVLFIVYIVHHGIARKHSLKTKIEWASNEIINQFDSILRLEKDCGLVIFDKLPFKGEFRYINNLFNDGITTSTSQNAPHVPTNILGYSMSTSGASHFNSATDIILGAFRYCVNAEDSSGAAKKLFPKILNLLYGQIGKDGKKAVGEYGLLIRPRRNMLYSSEYDKLLKKLKSFL